MTELAFDHLRNGDPDCPSDYALDRLHMQDVQGPEADALRSHVRACEQCTARMQQRQGGFAALGEHDPDGLWNAIRTAEPPPSSLAARIRRIPRGAAVSGLLAVAAALALVWLPSTRPETGTPQGPVEREAAPTGREGTSPAPATVRAKGEFTLRVYRKRGEGSEEVSSGDTFQAGDTLRFSVFLPEPGRVRVLGREADGTLYTAWPQSPMQLSWFDTGGTKLLPGAVQLDDSPGRETLYALRCPKTIESPQCRSVKSDPAPRCPAECDLASFVLNKEVP